MNANSAHVRCRAPILGVKTCSPIVTSPYWECFSSYDRLAIRLPRPSVMETILP